MMLVRIYCDSCGWEKKDQIVKDWLNIPCPGCKADIPIKKVDFYFFQFLRVIKVLSDIYSFLKPHSNKKEIHVSSRAWRNKFESRQEK